LQSTPNEECPLDIVPTAQNRIGPLLIAAVLSPVAAGRSGAEANGTRNSNSSEAIANPQHTLPSFGNELSKYAT
jgi:hypothetical protein